MTLFSYIKSNLSILDVILEYVQLKQAGNYWKGACPFHSEKEGSFTVSPDKGIFYCFGCHAGGDSIAFVAKAENISQLEAARHLVDRFKLKVPKNLEKEFSNSQESADEKGRHSLICSAIVEWTGEKLLARKEAMNYLSKRSIDVDEINYFDLGYLPGGFRNVDIFVKAMQRKNILLHELLDFGFLAQSSNNTYSPFEERIIFPIKDILGRIVGFGGRVFKKTDQRAKYYNSKDSKFFQKGNLLFGLDLAKAQMRDEGFAFLVEGYTDCVSMAKHGYKNVVATLGTACRQEHLKILARYINTLYVLYDGDQAGQKAILRLVELCWGVNLDLKIVHLPEGDDPASYLEKGEDLKLLIGQSKDILPFYIDSLGAAFLSKSLGEKLNLGKKIISSIARIDDELKRDLLLQRASVVMQVSLSSLKDYLNEHNLVEMDNYDEARINTKSPNTSEKTIKRGFSDEISHLEKKILFAIINNVDKNQDEYVINNDILEYFSKQMRFFLDKVGAVRNIPAENRFTEFFDSLDEDQRAWVSYYSLKYDQIIGASLFSQLIFQFQKQCWKSVVRNAKREILEAKNKNDIVKFKKLSQKFLKLKLDMKGKGIL